ncbi:Thymidylate_kin domain-containing protein [Cephalotus follicularis]|uniref:Thymidylate kinase n=1 Tax=Cephalotus follicularis TaxID=3775 RepID=A0A1Q3B8X9_CEPFO|nr:Thymidylate_kin domain-containing protein [Cephalotus follicularis]
MASPSLNNSFRHVKDMTLASSFVNSKVLNFGALALLGSLSYYRSCSCTCSFRPNLMENCQYSSTRGDGYGSRGALIVLEGLDRSGKSSQCRMLLSYLEGLGHSAELWRFPDRSTSVGKMINEYLSDKSQLDDHTIHLLFSANRWEKRSLMETKLKMGTTLIIDRYSYSGVVFSSAKGLDFEWCKTPEIGLLAPDLVVYLDILPEKAAERAGYGGERYEQLEFQKKVSQCYKLLSDFSWEIIDACQSMEDVGKQIKEIVLDQVMACKKGKPLSNLWP